MKAIVVCIVGILILIGIVVYVLAGYSDEYILIDGADIILYDIVDGNTIIIHTEDEQYEVLLHDDVVDFTVNSNITIELFREYLWGEPVSDYWINRIIKTPTIVEEGS